jgi:hypothetical protein
MMTEIDELKYFKHSKGFLFNCIKKMMVGGESHDEIKKKLVEAEYTPEEAEQLMRDVVEKVGDAEAITIRSNKRVFYALILALIVVISSLYSERTDLRSLVLGLIVIAVISWRFIKTQRQSSS